MLLTKMFSKQFSDDTFWLSHMSTGRVILEISYGQYTIFGHELRLVNYKNIGWYYRCANHSNESKFEHELPSLYGVMYDDDESILEIILETSLLLDRKLEIALMKPSDDCLVEKVMRDLINASNKLITVEQYFMIQQLFDTLPTINPTPMKRV
mgnify:CR=1 FL=1